MPMDSLSHVVLHRTAQLSAEGYGRQERFSIDFIVNGHSLLGEFAKRRGWQPDVMGCLCKDLPEDQGAAIAKLRAEMPPDTETGRVILYMCPECGDIGCGAYSVVIEHTQGEYVWRSFAYENGYEPAASLEGLGPFRFEAGAYHKALIDALQAL